MFLALVLCLLFLCCDSEPGSRGATKKLADLFCLFFRLFSREGGTGGGGGGEGGGVAAEHVLRYELFPSASLSLSLSVCLSVSLFDRLSRGLDAKNKTKKKCCIDYYLLELLPRK